jgi:hypothetical protein
MLPRPSEEVTASVPSSASGRVGLAGVLALGVLFVLTAAVAGGATQAAFRDTETSDAGTIRIVGPDEAPIEYNNCRFMTVRPADPDSFTLTVTTVDGQTGTYDQSDLGWRIGDAYWFWSRVRFPGNPEIQSAVLDGQTYPSGC